MAGVRSGPGFVASVFPSIVSTRSIRSEEAALSVRACQVTAAASIIHDCGTSAAAMTTGRGGAPLPQWDEGFNQNLMNYA